jgi:putative addiction module component (TIGR02574 family)
MKQGSIQNQIIELIHFVENKKILKAVHTILEQEAVMPKLSQAQMEELDRREEKYLKGEGKNYTWEEVKLLIRNKSEIV